MVTPGSLGPSGVVADELHGTSEFNILLLFPYGWADRQADRIFLEGKNFRETIAPDYKIDLARC